MESSRRPAGKPEILHPAGFGNLIICQQIRLLPAILHPRRDLAGIFCDCTKSRKHDRETDAFYLGKYPFGLVNSLTARPPTQNAAPAIANNIQATPRKRNLSVDSVGRATKANPASVPRAT
jgi:hypothetical protein